MLQEELNQILNEPEQFKEIWLEGKNGEMMCALINGDIGWLMYLRFEGDEGFSTRNYDLASTENIEFFLNNGQVDIYPKNWTYKINVLLEAIKSFLNDGKLPPQLEWHDNSQITIS